MTKICFICLGNICRSPTAEGVMNKLIQEAQREREFEIDSAGTGSWHVGHPADARSRETAEKYGYELLSHSRQVTEADFHHFDLLIAMDRSNEEDLKAIAPTQETEDKIRLLRQYDPKTTGVDDIDVPDPYYGGHLGFENVLAICERSCRALLESLEQAL